MVDDQSSGSAGSSEIAELRQRVATARGKLPLQTDPALLEAMSDSEIAAERELAEWIRAQRRQQRRRAVTNELAAEQRDRKVADSIRRSDEADAHWHRRALAARRRVSSPDARLAQLFRRAEWSSRALIAVVVLGMIWAGVNVQHNLVPSGDMTDPLYWLSYGFEAMISIPIITIMVVTTTAARWGRDVARGKVVLLEIGLLSVTIALNAGPHIAAGRMAHAAEAAVAPIMVGVIIWLHAWVAARYATLIDGAPVVDTHVGPAPHPRPVTVPAEHPHRPHPIPHTPTTFDDRHAHPAPTPSHSPEDPPAGHLPIEPRNGTIRSGLIDPIPMTDLPRPVSDPIHFPSRNGHGGTNGHGYDGLGTRTGNARPNGHNPEGNPAGLHDSSDRARQDGRNMDRRSTNGHDTRTGHNGHDGHDGRPNGIPFTDIGSGRHGSSHPNHNGHHLDGLAHDDHGYDVDMSYGHNGFDSDRLWQREEPSNHESRTGHGAANGLAYDSDRIDTGPISDVDRETHSHNEFRDEQDDHIGNRADRGRNGRGANDDRDSGNDGTARQIPNGRDYDVPNSVAGNSEGDHDYRGGSSRNGSDHRDAGRAGESERSAHDGLGGQNGRAINGGNELHGLSAHSTGRTTDDHLVAESAPERKANGYNHNPAAAFSRTDTAVAIADAPESATAPVRPAVPVTAEPQLVAVAAPASKTRQSPRAPREPEPAALPGLEMPAREERPTRKKTDPRPAPAESERPSRRDRADRVSSDEPPAARTTSEPTTGRRRTAEADRSIAQPLPIPADTLYSDSDDFDTDIAEVEIWSVARDISNRGMSRLPVEQLVEILTFADQSWTPAAIGAEVGMSGSAVLRILEAARRLRAAAYSG
ncbi:hypothetical protein [Nocardia aurantia]|uniref:DUF2637 domain-containing protein n=1 Tax=Nocardia aurantia TaxID=2585199 RepID=A0A7K0DGG7_9NOCA|nr:hypothetical protein [Nocardia aurantia]MQY24910.1 hypothetical protein [Nocardia aurantia]